MKLEKEYGGHFDFKHDNLIPETVEECAIFEKLAKDYPEMFKIRVDKPYCQPYQMILIIKKQEEK